MGMNGDSRRPRCTECGREIMTFRAEGSIENAPVNGAPIVCRKCFGESTYKGGNRYTALVADGSLQASAETAMTSGFGSSSSD